MEKERKLLNQLIKKYGVCNKTFVENSVAGFPYNFFDGVKHLLNLTGSDKEVLFSDIPEIKQGSPREKITINGNYSFTIASYVQKLKEIGILI